MFLVYLQGLFSTSSSSSSSQTKRYLLNTF